MHVLIAYIASFYAISNLITFSQLQAQKVNLGLLNSHKATMYTRNILTGVFLLLCCSSVHLLHVSLSSEDRVDLSPSDTRHRKGEDERYERSRLDLTNIVEDLEKLNDYLEDKVIHDLKKVEKERFENVERDDVSIPKGMWGR